LGLGAISRTIGIFLKVDEQTSHLLIVSERFVQVPTTHKNFYFGLDLGLWIGYNINVEKRIPSYKGIDYD
jgi:hypothetical protein